jgi:hypothetical protein
VNRRSACNVAGAVLLLAWATWWGFSIRQDHLALSGATWIPAWQFLGVDFLHNYLAVNVWLGGENPYHTDLGNLQGNYTYPPLVLPMFAWCGLVGDRCATIIWMAVIAAGMGTMAWIIAKHRGFSPPLATALVLLSTPIMFAMERGNCDVIVLLLLAMAALAMKKKTAAADCLAGILLAIAMWTKIYPGLAVLGLLPLRRWRVFGWAVAAGLVIGLVPFSATRDFFQNERYRSGFISSAANLRQDPGRAESGQLYYPPLEAVSHSLPIYWRTFWTGYPQIQRIPGMIGVGLILGPMIGWVAWKIYRSQTHDAKAWAFLLWITLAATFWMPVSYDYNLIYLPILALAVVSWRSGLLPMLLVLPVCLYLQPFTLPISLPLLLLFKLMALAGLGIFVTRQAGLRKWPTS